MTAAIVFALAAAGTTYRFVTTRIHIAGRCLTITVGLTCAIEPALGQLRLPSRRTLVVTPPRGALGRAVTLSVQGAPNGAKYRYVATVTSLPNSQSSHTNCPQQLVIGSGAHVTWQPKSGAYRLTAYGPLGHETDTLRLMYSVAPRPVMLATSQTPAGSSGVTLVLRTDDLGPGHQYMWWMEYRNVVTNAAGVASAGVSETWMTHTTGPMATHPTPIPSSATIKATVSIHRGDPCDIIAAGARGPGS